MVTPLKKRPTKKDRQTFLRYYRDVTGEAGADPIKVAELAKSMGWPDPPPTDPIRRSAKLFARAAREEIKHDDVTGDPYRANLAVTETHGDTQLALWYDIDNPDTKRSHVWKALVQDREQLVGGAVQMSFTEDHWNRMHPNEEPIVMPKDLTPDVEWRRNEPKKKAS